MVERVKSKKKRRERILIKNSLVFKVNVVSNKVNSVFLCIYFTRGTRIYVYYGAPGRTEKYIVNHLISTLYHVQDCY